MLFALASEFLSDADSEIELADLGGKRSTGRLHGRSACGLLNADFRTPSLDYREFDKSQPSAL